MRLNVILMVESSRSTISSQYKIIAEEEAVIRYSAGALEATFHDGGWESGPVDAQGSEGDGGVQGGLAQLKLQ